MRFIDLFAGAGGFSEGFKRAGYEPVAHVEMDKAACMTLRTRLSYYYLLEHDQLDSYESYLRGEIDRETLYSLVPTHVLDSVVDLPIGDKYNCSIFNTIDRIVGNRDIDVIVGGPPCQAYSVIGRARDQNGMLGDSRSYLYIQYGRFLKRYNPKVFVFENVMGLLSAERGKYYRNLNRYFRRLGYVVRAFIVNARDFGVLQNRIRVIMIGLRKDLDRAIDDVVCPISVKYKVSAIFEDLPRIPAGGGKDKYSEYAESANPYLLFSKIRTNLNVLTQHIARPHTEQDKEIYRMVVEKWNTSGDRLRYDYLPTRLKTHRNMHSFQDRFKVVAANLLCSQTVVAHIAKDGHYYIHPDILQNRSISVREAARLQSFPDDYYFESAGRAHQVRTPAFRQIGNAVPPLMIEAIAARIRQRMTSD